MAISCSGNLSTATDGAALCDADWVVEPAQLDNLYILLNSAFSTPEPSDIIGAFMAGLTIPMISYLTAWGYGIVLNWIGSSHIND